MATVNPVYLFFIKNVKHYPINLCSNTLNYAILWLFYRLGNLRLNRYLKPPKTCNIKWQNRFKSKSPVTCMMMLFPPCLSCPGGLWNSHREDPWGTSVPKSFLPFFIWPHHPLSPFLLSFFHSYFSQLPLEVQASHNHLYGPTHPVI